MSTIEEQIANLNSALGTTHSVARSAQQTASLTKKQNERLARVMAKLNTAVGEDHAKLMELDRKVEDLIARGESPSKFGSLIKAGFNADERDLLMQMAGAAPDSDGDEFAVLVVFALKAQLAQLSDVVAAHSTDIADLKAVEALHRSTLSDHEGRIKAVETNQERLANAIVTRTNTASRFPMWAWWAAAAWFAISTIMVLVAEAQDTVEDPVDFWPAFMFVVFVSLLIVGICIVGNETYQYIKGKKNPADNAGPIELVTYVPAPAAPAPTPAPTPVPTA